MRELEFYEAFGNWFYCIIDIQFDNLTHMSIERMKLFMAKAGMKRPDPSEPHGTESNHKTHFYKNAVRNVPQEIQGKAQTGNKKAPPIE